MTERCEGGVGGCGAVWGEIDGFHEYFVLRIGLREREGEDEEFEC